MKLNKKTLVTFLTALIMTFCLSDVVAYASEPGETEQIQETTTYDGAQALQDQNSVASQDIGTMTPVEDSLAADTDLDGTYTEGADTEVYEETDLDAEELEEKQYFVDEQGQVYYIEEEPEDIVIKESIEDEVTEEETEEAVKPSYSEKDLRLLASLIYAEAGNQSYNGMLAVANVVLNRAKSDVYWHVDTVEEVIYDKKWAVQFSVTIKSKKTGLSMLDKALKGYDTGKFTGANPEAEKKAMKKAIKAAKAALEGENNIGSYLCFRANNRYASSIKKKYDDYKIIGDHIFYRAM
ncbi:cell wall hydrolase [Mobilitalea sibirica]|uniref:Cell wall hydrolase n=1 Tax=Mobilitalea sibirica TaxID=1462919 RepID=A0A8J7H526_9FIRM|nr:cell wall hydrolase [Mobilitalea sibirica]MBH1941579.1 cell wall hydrolase [Mobilitalea sibirica]